MPQACTWILFTGPASSILVAESRFYIIIARTRTAECAGVHRWPCGPRWSAWRNSFVHAAKIAGCGGWIAESLHAVFQPCVRSCAEVLTADASPSADGGGRASSYSSAMCCGDPVRPFRDASALLANCPSPSAPVLCLWAAATVCGCDTALIYPHACPEASGQPRTAHNREHRPSSHPRCAIGSVDRGLA